MAKDELDDYPTPATDELDSFPVPSTREHGAFAEGKGGGFDPVELAPTVPSNSGKYSAKNPDGTYVNPNFNVPVSEKIPAMQAGAAGKELITSPVATLTNPAKRRELERGASDMTTLGLAEKAGNAVDPKFAATAETDPNAAPGMRTVGAAIGAPLPSAVNNVIGRAVGGAVSGTSKAITALAPKAEGRVIERAATALGEGATKATKGKLGIGNEGLTETREGAATRNVLKGDEELVKVADKGDKKLAPVAKRIREVASKKLDEIYANSDAASSSIGTQGVSTLDPILAMDERIAALRDGNVKDRQVADKLQSIRDEFSKAHNEGDYIPAKKLRAEQSGYQDIGYDRKLDTPTVLANQEASKAVGDAVVKNVTGMKYAEAVRAAMADPTSIAAQLLKANEQVAVASKIDGAIASRVGSNPGSPHRMTALIHGGVSSVAAMGATAAGMMHHGAMAAGIMAAGMAGNAAPYVLKLADKSVIALSHVPANPQIVKYAQKMGALGMKAAQIDLAVKRLNKEQENVAGPE